MNDDHTPSPLPERRHGRHGRCLLALLILICGGCEQRPAAQNEASRAARLADPSTGYAGSAACRGCHPGAFELWRRSNHGQAERAIDPARDARAFAIEAPIRHGSVTSRVRTREGVFEIITQGRDLNEQVFRAQRVLGNDPLRQFLVPNRGGRFQMTALAFDPHKNEWFDVFGEEDRQPHEWGHWTNRGMTWNSMCADCHNTNLYKNYDAQTDAYDTRMAEMGVGCEACHGPGRAHVDWQDTHRRDEQEQARDPALTDFRSRYAADLLVDACGVCHSRRVELRESYRPGEPLLDSFIPATPDLSDGWYADGQVHEEDYVYASFLMSRMRAEGVHCADCHRPHDLGLRADGNDLCLRCHEDKIDPAGHSFHDVTQPGGQCVECHMPHTVYMQRHPRRDHGFTIPDPKLTLEFGIPNACNRCHSDRSVEWAIVAVDAWYGERMKRRTQERARLIARARGVARGLTQPSSDQGPRQPSTSRHLTARSEQRAEGQAIAFEIIRMLRDEDKPMWRAIFAAILREWAGVPQVRRTLIASLDDEAALVRSVAASGLDGVGPEAVEPLRRRLNDPVRAVRIAAASSLGSSLSVYSQASRELREYMEHNADQPAGVVALAGFLLDHGKAAEALERVERALTWQPDFDALHYTLGRAFSALGRREEAVAALRRACELSPQQSLWWYALGLAQAAASDRQAAAGSLRKACELDPLFTRAWYNLALVHNALAEFDQAIAALTSAIETDPENPDLHFTLATIYRDASRISDARQAAQAALRIDASHAPSRALLRSLE